VALVVLHGQEIFLDLSQVLLKIGEFFFFFNLKSSHKFDFLVVTRLSLFVVAFLCVLENLVILISVLSVRTVIAQITHFTFKSYLLP